MHSKPKNFLQKALRPTTLWDGFIIKKAYSIWRYPTWKTPPNGTERRDTNIIWRWPISNLGSEARASRSSTPPFGSIRQFPKQFGQNRSGPKRPLLAEVFPLFKQFRVMPRALLP